MQEAPNSYEKDEQQERGNYDSAVLYEASQWHFGRGMTQNYGS